MKKRTNNIFVSLIVFILGGVTMYGIMYFSPLSSDSNKDSALKLNQGTKVVEKTSLAGSIAKAYDAVVVIQGYNNNDVVASTGTGFVYKTKDGKSYILTNAHVVNKIDRVEITTSTDETAEAKILGKDEYLDLAVLSIDSKYAKGIVELGDSSKMDIGDVVFTIGSPMGYNYRGSVTSGILSGKDRMVTVSVGNSLNGDWVMRVLQTDAAINPGNSGGPLLNINGEVIGINSMKLVQEEIEGMGFAIPIEFAMVHIDSLEKSKKIEWPILGISMLNVTDKGDLSRNNIDVPDNIKSGVVVLSIAKDSGASKSDLKKGDIIIKLNKQEVKDYAYLRYELYKHQVGDTIEITYIRDGKEKTTKVKLTKSQED